MLNLNPPLPAGLVNEGARTLVLYLVDHGFARNLPDE